MKENIKNVIVTVIFFTIIIGIFIISLFKSPTDISLAERRKLTQLPELSVKSVLDATFMSKFEKYTLDQFVGRDTFRKIKAFVMYNIFNQSDNNKIYIVDGQVTKYLNTLNENEVKGAADKFNKLYDKFLSDTNVYYSIIPDKNYYIAEKNGYPHIDYEKFESLLCDKMNSEMTYIDIFDVLSIDDYYTTDTHWRQEKIGEIVNKLAEKMQFKKDVNLIENKLDNFYGVYYGQSALPIESEEMIYLTSDIINNATVYTLDEETMTMKETEMYNKEDFDNTDPYDIFLGGAKPLIVIENNQATTDKTLTIFRDSYGSSLAPLLTNGYKKITVVDLRYIATPLLNQFITFEEGQDVLIIKCVDVLNNSSILKVF